MSGRVATLVRNDARQQFRYGIYYAYAFVMAFYVLVLTLGADFIPDWMPGMIIFTDPAVVGFFFLGALMLLEKSENVRTALAVTPVSAANYFWSKSITLTGLALVAVSILTPFLHTSTNWPLLLAAVALTSIFFLGIGVLIAYRFKSATSYLMGATGYLTPVVAPGFMALLDPMPVWAIIIPTASQFKLILIATGAGTGTALEIAAMLIIAALAAAASVTFAIRRLQQEFGA